MKNCKEKRCDRKGKHLLLKMVLAVLAILGISLPASANQQIIQIPLFGVSVPKYVDPMPTFTGARVQAGTNYTVSMEEFQQRILPDSLYDALPAPFNAGSYVWGYKVNNSGPLYPGFTVEAQKGTPVTVTYTNNLVGPGGAPPVLQKYLSVDQTLHWADPMGLMCLVNPTDPECLTPYGYPTWPGTPLLNPQPTGAPVPAVVHLHGGEVPSAFDGGPEQWWTPDGLTGRGYVSLSPVPLNQTVYRYPNAQEATTLWFHDHALGTTRLNVYGGMAAFYLLRDNRDTGLPGNPIGLPAGAREQEIVIQDRMFDTNGQLLYPDDGVNPTFHPFWTPEFFGDVIVVNGKSWPFFNVQPRRYRLRFLNGSNARFYNMELMNIAVVPNTLGPRFRVIGTDGGFLNNPVNVSGKLLIAPGERYDVIVDFAGFEGQTLTLVNNARSPFPFGDPVDPATTGQLMQFRVGATPLEDATCVPFGGGCDLRGANPIVRLANPSTGALGVGVVPDKVRQLTLVEVPETLGPFEAVLNNTRWLGLKESTVGVPGVVPAPIADSVAVNGNWATEFPRVGATEVWEIINLTADAHPIHLHLVQFQIMNRQKFNSAAYLADWEAALAASGLGLGDGPPSPYDTVNADGAVGGNLPLANGAVNYLGTYPIMPSRPFEHGWKDTVVVRPGQVTRIVVRWSPQNVPKAGVAAGTNLYPFDPTIGLGDEDFAGNPGGPGYVWHCHILEHEDNEMMRPYIPRK